MTCSYTDFYGNGFNGKASAASQARTLNLFRVGATLLPAALLALAHFVADHGAYACAYRRAEHPAGEYGTGNSTADSAYSGVLLTGAHFTATAQTNDE